MRAHAYVFLLFIISFSSVCARSRGPHSSNQLICSRHCAALGLFMCARVCECVPRARLTMRTLTPAGSWPRIRETHFVFCSVFSRARHGTHARTLASTRTRPVIGAGRSVCVRACSVETQIHAIHAVYIESRPGERACVRACVIATMRARSTLLPGPGRPYARTNLIRSL